MFGQAAFLGVIVAIGPPSNRGLRDSVTTLFWLDVALLAAAVFAGGFTRKQVYKRHWLGDAIMPRGYVIGNIVLLSMLVLASLVGLLLVMLHGRLMPMVVVPLVAMGFQILNFPTGTPMRPSCPLRGWRAES